MIVRFGYVAMSMIVQNASPSKTMTYSQFSKLTDREAALRKLERIAEENLHNTKRLLFHNRAHDIQLYRFSSKLIPLIGHEEFKDWDPFPVLLEAFEEIGKIVQEDHMRVSFHPDHFTVMSTPRPEVLQTSIQDLDRHVRMLEAMGLSTEAKCNIHIGGAYGNKPKTMERFLRQFADLSTRIRERITLENDDKTFHALETLEACEHLGVPMVLDIHHHEVNPSGNGMDELWPRILKTWEGQGIPPKIHASSPKSERDPRGHADHVNPDTLLSFFREISAFTPQLDVMIEAKKKDEALFQLMERWKDIEGIRIINGASIEVE